MAFKIKVINTGLRNYADYNALLRRQARIGQATSTVIANDGSSEKKKKGSYYPNKVEGATEIEAYKGAVYEVTDFLLYRGKEENEEDLKKDKTQLKWIFHMPDVEIKNNLLNYFELSNGVGGQAKIQEDSKTDFMDIADPKKRTEAIMRHGITYIKIEGDEKKQKTKLTVKFSKWLDGYKVHIEAYRRNPDVKKKASGATVATTVKAKPEIIKGYWVNDKREEITNKTVGYKDTVYMCLKTLGMAGRIVTTALWEEGITFMGSTNSNDETICMNENIEWKLTERLSYKKLEIPDQNTEEYKKQREGIWETDPLELYFKIPNEKEITGYKPKFGQLLYLTTKEGINDAYFAKQIKRKIIKDGTVKPKAEKPKTHTVQRNETLSLIAPKYSIHWKKDLAAHNNINAPWALTVGQVLKLPSNAVIPEQNTSTSASQEEAQPQEVQQETVYERIDTANLGSEVYIVVETANLHGKKVNIEVFDNERLLANNRDTAITVLKDDTEVTKLENIIIDDTGKAKIKVKLRKKSDEDYEKQKDKFKVKNIYSNNNTGQEEELCSDDQLIKNCPNDYTLVKEGSLIISKLFLKIECTGNDKTHKKEFLDGEEFEVKNSKDPNIIYIVRKWEKWVSKNSKSATFGEFTFDDLSGYICEPYGEETTKSGLDKRIPVGKYNIKWHVTTKYNKKKYTKNSKYGKKFNLDFDELSKGFICLYNEKVSKSRAILMHAGTDGRWSEGCILPGKTLDRTKNTKNIDMKESVETLYDILGKIEEKGINNIKIVITDEID
ncbi:hypothetical protein A8C32_03725 [Flavivirga aquatica]|uniref:LysM domain-containing protein n=1 Tax=Flavivirga aquatica TaxID=1849968 RepID=A0A1E5TB29_9FLAO|nr:DUF5675 family protein [Flavivirga aquatica]OEK08570.1 hypothetical protein A8C32_03725 [Flavivirga aquatica]